MRQRLPAKRHIASGLVLLAVLTVMVARRPDAGPVVATVTVGTSPVSLAVDAQTGRAFVVNNGDDNVSVLDSRTGSLRRLVAVGKGPTTVIVDERDRRVLVANADAQAIGEEAGHIVLGVLVGDGNTRSVSVLDAASGHLLRTVAADVSPRGDAADGRSGAIFVSTNADDLSSFGVGVLRPASTRVLRAAAMPGFAIAAAVDRRAKRVIIVGESNDREATVSMLDATNGRVVRRTVIGTVFGAQSLAVDEATGRAFAITTAYATGGGSLCVFDTHSGALLYATPLQGAPSSVAVDERSGHVFVTTLGFNPFVGISLGSLPLAAGSGSVTMLDERGAVLRSIPLGMGPGVVAVDARHRHVLVANVGAMDEMGVPMGPGSVSVLDAQSGALLRTVRVGIAPAEIAVDERAGRAFVLNFGGVVRMADPWRWMPPWLRQWLPFVPRHASGIRTVRGSVTVLDTARLSGIQG